MWLCLNDAFLSIVHKDCPEGSLLVRARRPGDIEKVFGRRVRVMRLSQADYLYRAVVTRDEVVAALEREVMRVGYGNFKDSVGDGELHDAYLKVWSAMASLQDPRPYSEPWRWRLTGTGYESPLTPGPPIKDDVLSSKPKKSRKVAKRGRKRT